MNERANSEHLLREVLAEATDADFRAALLDQSLRLAGRRRRWRQARRAAAVVGVVFGLAALLWHFSSPRAGGPASGCYALVHTQPLAAGAVVTTQPLAPDRMLSSFSGAELVQTPPRGPYHEVDDRQLLELAAPTPAVLVRSGPHLAELVFASSPGEERPQN